MEVGFGLDLDGLNSQPALTPWNVVDAQLSAGRYGYVQLAVHGFTELTESCPEHISLFALHVFGNAWKLLRHPCVQPSPTVLFRAVSCRAA